MKRVFRRPSPAMVVAIVALFAAIGGTALAGGFTTKKKVNKIINNRAPGLSVGSAKNADSAKHADAAANAEDVLWVAVNDSAGAGNASVIRGKPSGITVTDSTGAQVRFPRNVQNCAWNATNGITTAGAAIAGWAQTSATADPNEVEVRTRNDAGVITAQPFFLVVTC